MMLWRLYLAEARQMLNQDKSFGSLTSVVSDPNPFRFRLVSVHCPVAAGTGVQSLPGMRFAAEVGLAALCDVAVHTVDVTERAGVCAIPSRTLGRDTPTVVSRPSLVPFHSSEKFS
jgi:hypothetical protein